MIIIDIITYCINMEIFFVTVFSAYPNRKQVKLRFIESNYIKRVQS